MSQNLSIRAARREWAEAFKDGVQDYHCVRTLVVGLGQEQSPLYSLTTPLLQRIVALAFPKGSHQLVPTERAPHASPIPARAEGFKVCLRKRPVSDAELRAEEYDVLTCTPASTVVHDGRLDRNGRDLQMIHRHYHFDVVFGEGSANAEVYAGAMRPLVDRLLGDGGSGGGGSGTVICFGQTGSGKTHTMVGLQELAAADVFGRCDAEGLAVEAEVTYIELVGGRCRDLLAAAEPVHLRTDGESRVHVRGARVRTASSAAGLLAAIAEGAALRSIEATERNEASSRSHAMCDIIFYIGGGVGGGGGEGAGPADLAGSERNYETAQHTAEQHRDSAEINSSLMALKDCFRAHANNLEVAGRGPGAGAGAGLEGREVRVPYRGNTLTQMLRRCFEDPAHKTVVIAQVSPTPTDIEHTRNTIDHVLLMQPALEARSAAVAVAIERRRPRDMVVPVAKWTAAQVEDWARKWRGEWMVQQEDSGEGEMWAVKVRLPKGCDGKALIRLNKIRCITACGDDREAGGALYDAVRAEVKRVNALEAAARDRRVNGVRRRVQQELRGSGGRSGGGGAHMDSVGGSPQPHASHCASAGEAGAGV